MSEANARVLIVEDEQIVGYDIKQRLTRMGYTTYGPVSSPGETIAEIRQNHPQAILMDIFLNNSRMDGIAMADMVREQFDIPVIYLTAYSNEETVERAKYTAPYGFIHKPVADFELHAAIEMALYKHALEMRVQRLQKQLEFVLGETKTNVAIVDAGYNLRYVDSAWRQRYGDPQGKKCFRYFHNRNQPCAQCQISRALATKSICFAEYSLSGENNRPVQITTVPYQEQNGEWVAAELCIDLTERKRIEEQIRTQRDLALALAAANTMEEAAQRCLHAALALTGMECGGVYVCHTPNGPLTLAAAKELSPRFIQAVQKVMPQDERWQLAANGKPFYDLPSSLPPALQEELAREGLTALAMLPILHNNQLMGCCNLASRTMSSFPERARPVIELMITQVGHVFARLQAEHALQESEREHRRLFDEAPVGYHEIDVHGCLTRINKTELHMLGYTAEEMIGRPIWEFILEQEVSQAAVRSKLASGTVSSVPYERTFVRRDGTHLPVLVTEYAIYNEDGAIQGIRSALQDISEQKKAQSERAKLEAHMHEVQKLESIGLLAGGIAHDFNNLLMGIQGNTELALMRLDDSSPVTNFLHDIKKACQHASNLTGQLLAYAGKGKYIIEPVNLSTMTREMVQLLHTLIMPQTELQLELDDNLPPVEGDIAQLQQVVMNLITNAAEALPNGRGVIRLITREREIGADYAPSVYCQKTKLTPGKYCELIVEDNGCGMDENSLRKLFEPFFTTKFMGRGLGLAAVLGIIRNHGGDIHVQSQLGIGSRFTILLPSTVKSVAPPPHDLSTVKKPPTDKDGGCILLVDDDPAILRVVARYLEEHHFRVITCSDGVEALELYRRYTGELRAVILDMTIPGLSGEEVFRMMQTHHPIIPILVTSGYSEAEAMERFGRHKSLKFIQKPYELAILLSRLNEIIQLAGAESAASANS